MRNAYAQTAVPPLCSARQAGRHRGRPLDWSEVEDRSLRPCRFTIGSILDRLEQAVDPWKDLRRRRRSFSQAHKRLNAPIDEG